MYLEVSDLQDRKGSVTETLYYVKEHPESRWSSLFSPRHFHPSETEEEKRTSQKEGLQKGAGKFTTEPKVIEMCV